MHFHSRKSIWKWRLRNGVHFVSASMCQNRVSTWKVWRRGEPMTATTDGCRPRLYASNMADPLRNCCSSSLKKEWNSTNIVLHVLTHRFMHISNNSWIIYIKLDELMAPRQLKSPRSLSGRFIHLTLVTKWSQSWSWMTCCHPLCAIPISPPILRYSFSIVDHENPWSRSCVWSKVKVTYDLQNSKVIQGHSQGQTHWSHLRPGVQSICLLFVSWQLDHFWLSEI